jgi:hypothetical protein
MSLIRSAITGNYEPLGSRMFADCVIGLPAGILTGPGSVNENIALQTAQYGESNKPIIVHATLQDDLIAHGRQPSSVCYEPLPNSTSAGVAAWTVLAHAKTYMNENGLRRPLLVSHAFFMGRITAQALFMDLDPVIPEHLPRQFDTGSERTLSRRRALRIPREVVSLQVLKAQGKLGPSVLNNFSRRS